MDRIATLATSKTFVNTFCRRNNETTRILVVKRAISLIVYPKALKSDIIPDYFFNLSCILYSLYNFIRYHNSLYIFVRAALYGYLLFYGQPTLTALFIFP